MTPNHRAIQLRMRLIGALLLPVALFLLVCLLTYSRNDYPNSSLRPEQAFNIGGRGGALIAFDLMVLLGYCAYALPVIIGLLAWNRFKNLSLRLIPVILGAGLSLTLAGAATLSLITQIPENRRFEFAGATGLWLAQNMSGVFGTRTALLVSVTVFAGLILFTLAWMFKYRAQQRAASRTADRSDYNTPSMPRSAQP